MLLSQLVSALKALQVQGSSNEISMQSRYLLANSYQAIMNVGTLLYDARCLHFYDQQTEIMI